MKKTTATHPDGQSQEEGAIQPDSSPPTPLPDIPIRSGRKPKIGYIRASFRLQADAKARLDAYSFFKEKPQGDVISELVLTHLPEVVISAPDEYRGPRLAHILLDGVHDGAELLGLDREKIPEVIKLLATHVASNAEQQDSPMKTISLVISDNQAGRYRLKAANKSLELRGAPGDTTPDEWVLLRKVARFAAIYAINKFHSHS